MSLLINIKLKFLTIKYYREIVGMKNCKYNPIGKKAEIIDLYKAGSFYGTISLEEILKNNK